MAHEQLNRPSHFPKPGSDQAEQLQSLLEKASPEEVKALVSLFRNSLARGIGAEREQKVVLPTAAAYWPGRSIFESSPAETNARERGLEDAAYVAQSYGSYLTHLAEQS